MQRSLHINIHWKTAMMHEVFLLWIIITQTFLCAKISRTMVLADKCSWCRQIAYLGDQTISMKLASCKKSSQCISEMNWSTTASTVHALFFYENLVSLWSTFLWAWELIHAVQALVQHLNSFFQLNVHIDILDYINRIGNGRCVLNHAVHSCASRLCWSD